MGSHNAQSLQFSQKSSRKFWPFMKAASPFLIHLLLIFLLQLPPVLLSAWSSSSSHSYPSFLPWTKIKVVEMGAGLIIRDRGWKRGMNMGFGVRLGLNIFYFANCFANCDSGILPSLQSLSFLTYKRGLVTLILNEKMYTKHNAQRCRGYLANRPFSPLLQLAFPTSPPSSSRFCIHIRIT